MGAVGTPMPARGVAAALVRDLAAMLTPHGDHGRATEEPLAKRKHIGQADITGEKGIALIHRTVLDMGCVWNPTKLEAGIDGYIELRDRQTGEVTNCILQVQSKASPSWFKAEN